MADFSASRNQKQIINLRDITYTDFRLWEIREHEHQKAAEERDLPGEGKVSANQVDWLCFDKILEPGGHEYGTESATDLGQLIEVSF